MLMESAKETVKITAMVFGILIGATAFSMVFTYTGGDMLIEEFMLAANQFVALNLHERSAPSIHRIHEAPDPARLIGFNEFVDSFKLCLPSPARSTDLQTLVKKVKG